MLSVSDGQHHAVCLIGNDQKKVIVEDCSLSRDPLVRVPDTSANVLGTAIPVLKVCGVDLQS